MNDRPRSSSLFESLPLRAGVLGGAVLVAMGVAIPAGYTITPGAAVLAAVGVAGGVCLVAGWAALSLAAAFSRPQDVVAQVVLGALVRMGITLADVILVYFYGAPLVNAGVLYYFIIFYLIALTMEILLVLAANKAVADGKRLSPREDLAD